MPKLILVASPHLAFGELLRLSLEESGKYRVRLARSGSEARNLSSKTAFALLMLDADLSDAPFNELVGEIKQNQPQARLILIPPENDPQHPLLLGLTADACINKPFYQPDLIKTVEAVLALHSTSATQEDAPDVPPPIVESQPSACCQRVLDKAVADGFVQAAFFLVGGQVQTSDGRLSTAALQELATTLSRTRGDHQQDDQIRFVRTGTEGELLLFSTGLSDQSELALACDSSLPLSRVRAKATALAREINGLDASRQKINQSPTAVAGPAVQAAVNVNEDDLLFDDSELEAEDIRVQELLAGVPLPLPPVNQPPVTMSSVNDWLPETIDATVQQAPTSPLDQTTPNVRFPFPIDPPPAAEATTIPIFHRQISCDDPTQPVQPQKTDLPKDRAGNNIQPPPPILPLSNPTATLAPDEPDQQLFLNAAPDSLLENEPVSMTYSRLSYSALLLPRFPQHALIGQLSQELAVWLPQVCVAFGWRLEGLAIRPDRLQFTFQAAPSISPGNVVRILRQQTSQRIFNRFPDLKELNPSGDFWAPGYLIISGSTPPPSNLLNDFVAQTRRRQGLAAA
ncbi:MAG TPA: transposase [Longilinea sp.]|nr:transposase [Longilinea sp.]